MQLAEQLEYYMAVKSTNITAVQHRVSKESRWQANRHKGGVLWFTGLSGSGKSTLAFELEHLLFKKGYQAYVLDGDNVRHGLCSDLGFSPEDRSENIRRIGETASLFAEAGFIVLSAFISPYRQDRMIAREAAGENFNEIYLSANVDDCEKRDPKGLYEKARRGEIPNFTGISAPYKSPVNPELVVATGDQQIKDSLEILLGFIEKKFTLTD